MGLFSLFKKPVIVQDDLFGRLQFIDSKDPSNNYFEGAGFFEPTQCDTEYLIQADIEGPTDEQRQFYLDLQANFEQYVEKITPLIEGEFQNWREDFKITNFTEEFTLVCITIPRQDTYPLIWDMAFTTIHDLDHHVTIDFIGKEPNGVLIDG
ncbi:MAG: hypothetical protein IPP79_16715 [Chitinophagaceae bacterium]|nr:hypothetical protein [Chitinophagaceae bacterium]